LQVSKPALPFADFIKCHELALHLREYVFKTLDSAVVPQEKGEPKRALTCVLATMLGAFIVFIRAFIRNGKEPGLEPEV